MDCRRSAEHSASDPERIVFSSTTGRAGYKTVKAKLDPHGQFFVYENTTSFCSVICGGFRCFGF